MDAAFGRRRCHDRPLPRRADADHHQFHRPSLSRHAFGVSPIRDARTLVARASAHRARHADEGAELHGAACDLSLRPSLRRRHDPARSARRSRRNSRFGTAVRRSNSGEDFKGATRCRNFSADGTPPGPVRHSPIGPGVTGGHLPGACPRPDAEERARRRPCRGAANARSGPGGDDQRLPHPCEHVRGTAPLQGRQSRRRARPCDVMDGEPGRQDLYFQASRGRQVP